MRLFLILLFVLISQSCSKPQTKYTDDYVLLEFAAKLEGQYHTTQMKDHHKENDPQMPQVYDVTPDPALDPQDP